MRVEFIIPILQKNKQKLKEDVFPVTRLRSDSLDLNLSLHLQRHLKGLTSSLKPLVTTPAQHLVIKLDGGQDLSLRVVEMKTRERMRLLKKT